MATLIDAPPDGAVAEAKAYLRIEIADEDALIGTLVIAGIALCEAFTGTTLLSGAQTATLGSAVGCWQRLPRTPVTAIAAVSALAIDGSATALALDGYAVDIDAAGDGWVQLARDPGAGRIGVDYTAGLAADWPSLPAPLRQGVVRLVAHLFAHRDEAGDAGPPAAVAALWRPWRRMRLA